MRILSVYCSNTDHILIKQDEEQSDGRLQLRTDKYLIVSREEWEELKTENLRLKRLTSLD